MKPAAAAERPRRPGTGDIVCEGLCKSFGADHVLRGITFTLPQGQCLALLGPSGCGKSTLLNILSGALAADGGELRLGDQILDNPDKRIHQPMGKRGFSMVFQDFSLWPHLSVEENVGFGLRVRKIPASERRRRVQEALVQVQMEAFAKRRPGQLSGGQQQRVSIARALVVEPRLLLLDEPLSALDARLREDLRNEIARLVRESGLTAVYVTHDQTEAFTIGHKVGLMNQGCLEQWDTPERLYFHPVSRFAAEFMGVANIWKKEEKPHLHLWESLAPLEKAKSLATAGTLCLRREDAHVVWKGNHGQRYDLAFTGPCRKYDFLGDKREVEVEVHPGFSLRGLSSQPLALGGKVTLGFDLTSLREIRS